MNLRKTVLFLVLALPALVLSLYGCGNSHRSTPSSTDGEYSDRTPDTTTTTTTNDANANLETRIKELTHRLETRLSDLRKRAGEGAENLADDTEKRLEQLRDTSRRLASATADESARVRGEATRILNEVENWSRETFQ